jgi:plasmid stabilization system protein ParE
MNYEIIFSPNALSTLDDLHEIILKKWGQIIADEFLSKVWRIMDLLKENPLIFKASENMPNVRLGLVDRHTSFLYEVSEKNVNILCFWNNNIKPFI